MEGLETVELRFSELEKGLRIDAELYNRFLVNSERKIRNLGYTTLSVEASTVRKGIFDIKSDCYSSEGIPFVRISNLKNMLIDTNDIVYIPQYEHDKNFQTALEYGDLILSKTANAAASFVNLKYCNTSQDTVAIKLKKASKVLSEYVVIFLNSKIGLKSMQRWFTGNIQMHLNLDDTKDNLLIPLLSFTIQNIIKELFENSIKLNEQSIALYSEAVNILLQELGLANWQPIIKNNNIKTLKESFLLTGRIDAEYYQPKYDEIESAIKKYKGGYDKLGNCIVEINTGEFASDYFSNQSGYEFFIRNTNISKGEIVKDDSYYVNPHTFTKFVREGDILTARVGAIGNFGTVNKDIAGSIYSDNVLNLRLKNSFIPEVYTCYFSTKPNLELINKISGGSVQALITQTSIKELLIPIFSIEIQETISQKVQGSFSLQKQSKHLLEVAKKAVEIAIEQSEAAAIKFINQNKNA